VAAPAGYSGTPLVRKLGVKEEHRVVLVGAPDGWHIDGLPPGVRLSRRMSNSAADVIIAFYYERSKLRAGLPALAGRITTDGAIWVAWPRRAGGHQSDITDNDIRAAVLPIGLVDVKVAALDEDWSGLKVVWRKKLRDRPTS
jgi:hypothetical protein